MPVGENPTQLIGHSAGSEKDKAGGDKCFEAL